MGIDSGASNVATAALQGIPFSSLIGGPLSAAVDAQSQSAQKTIEFIQEVGLTTDANGKKKAVEVDFIYYHEGKEARLVVPLLAILPIPYLAVETLDINFKASINASASTFQKNDSHTKAAVAASASASGGWGPFAASASFEASYSSKKDSVATQGSKYSVEYTVDVVVHAGQEDLPAGLSKVLNILGDSIRANPNKPQIKLSPSTLTATDPTQTSSSSGQSITVKATLLDETGKGAASEAVEVTIEDPAPTKPVVQLKGTGQAEAGPLSITTDTDGVAQFDIVISKETSGSIHQIGQSVKIKIECQDLNVSETLTLTIPAFKHAS